MSLLILYFRDQNLVRTVNNAAVRCVCRGRAVGIRDFDVDRNDFSRELDQPLTNRTMAATLSLDSPSSSKDIYPSTFVILAAFRIQCSTSSS